MATNVVQYGDVIDYVASAAVSSGDVVSVGSMAGVALVDIASGATGAVRVTGVVSVPKATGTAWTQGQRVNWDASGGNFVTTITAATGDVEHAGVAWAAAASGDATGLVRLSPGAGIAG